MSCARFPGPVRRFRQPIGKWGSEPRSRPVEKLQSAALHRSGYFANTGFIALFGSGFTGRRNILCACVLQNFLGPFSPLRIVGMHGKQYSAILNPALVTLSFVLRDSHANQGACEAAYCTAG